MCVYSCVNTMRSQSLVLPIMLSAARRGRGNLDRVVGQRCRPAVREIALRHEDHLHAARGRTERLVQPRRDVLGDLSQAPRLRLFTLVVVDVEPWRGDRAEPQPWIVAIRACRGRGPEQREAERQQQRAPHPSARLQRGAAARDVLQEREVGDRRQPDAGEVGLEHRDVLLVPEADVGNVRGNQLLRPGIERPPRRDVHRQGRFPNQPIDVGIAVVHAIEAGRRRLLRVIDAAEHVRDRSRRPIAACRAGTPRAARRRTASAARST